ncbi:MAG: Trk system potassium transporter TrkA [Spirochaetaceae bacterium]|nr:Trk system potassium transporter TrkA [Spirochaetaceae bacterium]
MKIAILGAGVLGTQLARELIAEQRDVIVIEKNPDIARAVSNDLDCMVVEGDGERLETLQDAGIGEVEWFIACTGSDETNIVSCGMVSEAFGMKIGTIARTRNPYFASFPHKGKRILGVDHLVSPEAESAQAIARIIFRGMTPELIDVKEAGIQVRMRQAADLPGFVDKPLFEIRAEKGQDFMVPAVMRKGQLIVPSGEFVMEEDDLVYLLGEPAQLDRLFGPCTSALRRFRSILIFGAEPVTAVLLHELGLEESAASTRDRARNRAALSLLGNPVIKVIDGNRDHVKLIARSFPDIESIHRSLTEENLLEEEGAGEADIVLCLTSTQSLNLFLGMLANRAGAKRTLALMENDLYSSITDIINVDIMLNKKAIVSGAILDLVRKARIRRLYSFPQNEYELIEIQVRDNASTIGQKIKNMTLPRGSLITFVIHQGRTMIPTGDTVIEKNDLVGFIVPKARIGALESIFGA